MEYPESKAISLWDHPDCPGVSCSVVQAELGHFCGYVRLPKRPFREQGYDGILTYVPVHGGITYADESKDGSMVYGFDCAHYNSGPETKELKWVKAETERLAKMLKLARRFERRYLLAKTNKGKAGVLDAMALALREAGLSDGSVPMSFGTMINILLGSL